MKTNVDTRQYAATRKTIALRRRLLPLLIAGCFGSGAVLANPTGHQIVSGQVGFSQQGSTLTVTNSPGAIINWQNFSINAGETTHFVQQSASSAVLNRVVGQDPSQILGALQSNGRVFLINPNGILFGEGARVDVNGLIASTLNMSNDDFLAGRMKFEGGGMGDLKNEGTISTPGGGQIYLVAPNVENSGILAAPNGDVLLAAGHSVHLVDSANPALQVVLSAPEHEALNVGQIVAQGGKASMYGALIRQRGLVSADSAVVGENGKIVFKASRDTMLEAGSRTTATGAGQGGEVQVLGDRVGIVGDAKVDAGGRAGGGTVLVGGDFQGNNTAIQNATYAYVGKDAAISADAGAGGNGGKVIVWSDNTTRAFGSISARGGEQGGDGGFVEVSGKQGLEYAAVTDVTAANGKTGTLLLDPSDIQIVGSDCGGACPAPPSFDGSIFFDDVGPSVIYESQLEAQSATADIMLLATNSITTSGSFVGGSVELAADSNLDMRTRNSMDMADYGINPMGIDLTGSTHGANLEFRTQGYGGISLQAGAGTTPYAATLKVGQLKTAGGHISLSSSGAAYLLGPVDASTGGIDITADSMNFSSTIGSLATGISGDVFLRPFSASRPINLGSEADGALGLTQTELAGIRSGWLMIGGPENTGGITVSAPVSFASDSVRELWLSSAGPITIASTLGKTEDATGANLDLHSNGNAITLSGNANISGWRSTLFNSAGGTISMATGARIEGATTGDDFGWISINSDTGVINLASGSAIRAQNFIDLTGDSMTLDGTIESTTLLSGTDAEEYAYGGVNIATYTDSRPIILGPTTKAPGTLTLTAAELQNIRGAHLGIGSWSHTGGITVSAPVVLSGTQLQSFGLSTSGNIAINSSLTSSISGMFSGVWLESSGGAINVGAGGVIDAGGTGEIAFIADEMNFSGSVSAGLVDIQPYSYGYGITVGSTNCHASPCLSVTNLSKINAPTIGIGHYGSGAYYEYSEVPGSIHVAGITYGSGNPLTDRHVNTKRIGLLTDGDITQSGAIQVEELGIESGGSVNLDHAGNAIQKLAAWTSGGPLRFVNSQGLRVIDIFESGDYDYGIFGVESNGGAIELATTAGDIDVASRIHAGTGTIALKAGGALMTSGIGLVEGAHLDAMAGNGMQLKTKVNSLAAANSGGNSAIQIENQGPLQLMNVRQTAPGTGSIYLSSIGELRVGAGYAVSSDAGAITMLAHSPLSVDGTVESVTGNIGLEAGSSNSGDDNLRVAGAVSTKGNVVLKAGAGVFDNNKVTAATLTKVENGNTTPTTTVIGSSVTSPAVVKEPSVATAIQTTQNTLTTTIASATQTATSTTTTGTAPASNTDEGADGTATADSEKQDDGSKSAAQDDTGASENEPVKKMYCN